MKRKIVLIGPGVVGCAIGQLLHRAGYPIAAIIGRNLAKTEEAARFIGCDAQLATLDLQAARHGDILLLALPDDQLIDFSASLHREVSLAAGRTLIHFSGLHLAEIMAPQHSGTGLLSIHPLLPFADRQMAIENLKNCPCAIEGDTDQQSLGRELVAALGGEAFILPSDAKATYHAAACIASNFMVSLTACARDLLLDCGFDKQQAMQLLGPIQRATCTNILTLGPEQALTGPIVRGDAGTVATHLQLLEKKSPQLAELYRGLGRVSLQLAQKSGRLTVAQAKKIKL